MASQRRQPLVGAAVEPRSNCRPRKSDRGRGGPVSASTPKIQSFRSAGDPNAPSRLWILKKWVVAAYIAQYCYVTIEFERKTEVSVGADFLNILVTTHLTHMSVVGNGVFQYIRNSFLHLFLDTQVEPLKGAFKTW